MDQNKKCTQEYPAKKFLHHRSLVPSLVWFVKGPYTTLKLKMFYLHIIKINSIHNAER